MTMYYSNPERASEPHALPDLEVFQIDNQEGASATMCADDGSPREAGWYWWSCFPGCLPDGSPIGPFATEEEALTDARWLLG